MKEFSHKARLGNSLIFSPLEEAIPKSAFDVEVLHTFIHYKNVTYYFIKTYCIILLKCLRTFYPLSRMQSYSYIHCQHYD